MQASQQDVAGTVIDGTVMCQSSVSLTSLCTQLWLASISDKAVACCSCALAVWDLAHSAGAVPVDLNACGADFAVGAGLHASRGPVKHGYIFVWC